MRRYASALLFSLSLLPFSVAAEPKNAPDQSSTPRQEGALSNQDVIKLVKLELGDEVVIAKINQAAEVKFDLTTDGLIHLKESGVNGAVITAMLDRATPKKSVGPAPGVGQSGNQLDTYGQDIKMFSSDQQVRLDGVHGDFTTSGFYPVVMSFLDYPGLHANLRTRDTKPSFLVRTAHSPESYYFIGKLDVNDGDNNRSLKIVQKGGAFSISSRVVPAKSWEVPFDVAEESSGLWRITPKAPLEKGEYGIVITGGILYEFGVD
jgi:hypothetical protein